MPRGGPPTNTYSLPAIYLAVPGTLITAAQHNTPLEDIAATLNTAWPVNLGGTGGTTAAALLADENRFTATQSWDKGADIASATALVLGIDGNYFHVTGTTTITSISTEDSGTWIALKFDAVLTLTHNATSLILPGAVNILTAAGDTAIFASEGSGNWRCLNYTPASGANTSMELLGTLTTTSGGSHAVTSIPAVYRRLYIEFDQVSFASDAYLLLALSSTNGAAYGTAVQASPTCIAGENLGGYIDVGNIQSNTSNGKSIVIALATSVGGVASQLVQRPSTNTAAACNAIRFQNNAGAAFDAGTIRVWGVR